MSVIIISLIFSLIPSCNDIFNFKTMDLRRCSTPEKENVFAFYFKILQNYAITRFYFFRYNNILFIC